MPDIVNKLRQNIAEASKAAREILNDPRTVIFDTETTGFRNPYICDLAIIERGRNGHNTILNTLINPLVRIPEDATRVHGISNSDVFKAPTFKDLWPQLEPLMRERRWIAYNAIYDVRVLSNEVTRIDPSLKIDLMYDCAMELYQQWCFGGLMRSGKHQTRLVDAHCSRPDCQLAAEEHEKAAHRAYPDTVATVKRLQMMTSTCWLHDHNDMEQK